MNSSTYIMQKRRILRIRLIWWCILIGLFLLPSFINAFYASEEVEFVDSEVNIDFLDGSGYIQSHNSVYIYLYFNRPCYGEATITLYNKYKQPVSKTFEFDTYELSTEAFEIVTIENDWKLTEYEINDIYAAPHEKIPAFIRVILYRYLGIPLFAFAVATFLIKCKQYTYLGKEIVVYSGWSIRIYENGALMDESPSRAKYASYTDDDGHLVEVKINGFNRITFRIDGRIYSS